MRMKGKCAWMVLAWLVACSPAKKQIIIEEVALSGAQQLDAPQRLSEWGFFQEPLAALVPVADVLPYDLNTPLFSDYAFKARFVRLPKGLTATYHPTEVMDFPVGTVLIKNFYYPADFRLPEGERRILETRLLVLKDIGWDALTYIWNDAQTDAALEVSGKTVPVSWKNEEGVLKNVNYSVPNLAQCKSCHDNLGKMTLIGPTARQLNRTLKYTDGESNQLAKWEALGLLTRLPPQDQWPVVPVWDDPATGTLEGRARAWLEINCAHCHRLEGPAKNSGLYLTFAETDPYRLGVNKPPIAAGRGSGGMQYSIVPGQPDASILVHRITSLDPGVMMPELGRKMPHDEGIALVREWIASMGK